MCILRRDFFWFGVSILEGFLPPRARAVCPSFESFSWYLVQCAVFKILDEHTADKELMF